MRKVILVVIMFAIVLACKKKGNDPVLSPPPAKAVLTSPAANETCFNGQSISASQSTVTFTWNSAENAESYDLVLKNLLSNVTSTHTAAQTSAQVTLLKATPYSWYVKSKSSKTSVTSISDTWKFYNAGAGDVSYAPFPAELVSPTFGQIITSASNTVKLDWTGSDVDNDIAGYAVYFGTTKTPSLLNANVAATEINNVQVVANTNYYWRVVTTDHAGNTSDSGLFQFKTN